MNRQTAAQLIALMSAVGEKLNDSVRLVRDESDSDSFTSHRDSVGKMMGIMFFDIMSPIFEEYPDLKPDSFIK